MNINDLNPETIEKLGLKKEHSKQTESPVNKSFRKNRFEAMQLKCLR